jgi:biotin transport system substrate-specific component
MAVAVAVRNNSFAMIICANILLALASLIKVPLPFSPVPIVVQLQICLMLPLIIGSRAAFLSVALLIGEAACGLPVLASGITGLGVFMGPTTGYLLGYLASAYVVKFAFDYFKNKSVHASFISMALGNLLVYGFGVIHLAQFVGFGKAILIGVVPFFLLDFVKLVLATKLLTRYGLDSICLD